ncbi:3D domain-containing protein [Niallia taxi]|uniref:3D domain-containing protein n=1 Tax=Niallia taxi TaxID=2499688 RepID=UPI0031719CDB
MKKTKLITAGVAALVALNGYQYHTYSKDRDTYKQEIKQQLEVSKSIENKLNESNLKVEDLQGELNTSFTDVKKLSEEVADKDEKIKEQDSQIDKLEKQLENNKKQVLPSVSSKSLDMTVTAYQPLCTEGCTGITKTGYDVSSTVYYQGYNIIATDPSVIPLYSIVEITLNNGRKIKAISLDTGGAIKNNIVDFLVASESEAIKFGRQKAKVTIIREGKGA